MEQVSWEDAQEFVRKLSAQAEEQAAGRRYRLPTEAESQMPIQPRSGDRV